MTNLDLIDYGKCPNGHGDMVFFKHPIDILYHIPVELLDEYEGKDTPPGMFGYIAAICQECGFTLSLEHINNLESYLKWLDEHRISSEEEASP